MPNLSFEPKEYNWRIFDVFVILFLASIIVPQIWVKSVQIIQGAAFDLENYKQTGLLWVLYAQDLALLWLTMASVRLGYNRPLTSIGVFRLPLGKVLGAGLLWGAGLIWAEVMAEQLSYLFFSSVLGAESLESFLIQETTWVTGLFSFGASPLRFLLLFVLLVVIVPVSEELFYRGFVFQSFRERFGSQGAVFLSAFVFALMHGYIVQFLPIFVIGVGLGYIVRHFGSIWPGVVGHALVNLISIVSILFSQ